MKIILCLLLFSLSVLCTWVVAQELVDINSADAQELAERLKGIGPAKAGAIVQFRSVNGPFKSIDELLQVKGIGSKTLEKLRALIQIGALETSRKRIDEARDRETQTRLTIRNIIQRANTSFANAPLVQ